MSKNNKYRIATCYCNPEWVENLYQFSKSADLNEVNCWLEQNWGSSLMQGTPFLFRTTKDTKDKEYIVGGGYFNHAEKNMTYIETWNTFREKNGSKSEKDLRKMVTHKDREVVSSQVITNPFFLERRDWILFQEISIGKVLRRPRKYYTCGDPDTEILLKELAKSTSVEMQEIINSGA